MTILYSNGCSYTANFDLLRQDRYPIILAERLGWEVQDRAEPGSCNARIIRTTIEDCIKLKDDHTDIVALVQLTHLYRTEYCDNSTFINVKPNLIQNNLLATQYSTLFCKLNSEVSLLTNLYVQILGLAAFLKQQNIKYLIYFGQQEVAINLTIDTRLYQSIAIDSNVLSLIDFSVLGSILGQSPHNLPVHPDRGDMKLIADYFYNLLDTSYQRDGTALTALCCNLS